VCRMRNRLEGCSELGIEEETMPGQGHEILKVHDSFSITAHSLLLIGSSTRIFLTPLVLKHSQFMVLIDIKS
jgi:hypothetical protein